MEPDLDRLPFLVVHGALVWKAALVAFVPFVLGLLWIMRRWLARRGVRRIARELEVRWRDEIVRGKLGGSGVGALAATLVASERSGLAAAVGWRASELWIETADGRVALAGAIRVVAGSSAHASRNRAPRATPDALFREPGAPDWLQQRRRVQVATLAALAAGDEVIARGRLERGPSDDPSGYRDGAPALTLHPFDFPEIEVAARAPRSAIARWSWPALVALAAIAAGIGWKLEVACGESYDSACSAYDRGRMDSSAAKIELSSLPACVLAAALPKQRDSALFRMEWLLEHGSTYRDRDTVETMLALAQLGEGCDGVIERLLSYERYADAVTVARRCGDRRTEHIAIALQGKLDEAAAIGVPRERAPDTGSQGGPRFYAALPAADLLIATGRWAEAADAAVARAANLRAGSHDADSQRSAELTALYYTCVAELFRNYAGDTAAAGRLRTLAAGADGSTCLPALTEIMTSDERRAAFARTDHSPALSEAATLLATLAWADPDSGHTGDDALVRDREAEPEPILARADGNGFEDLATGRPWLAALAPPTIQSRSMLRWRTVASVFDGDLVAAAASAKAAQPPVVDPAERPELTRRRAKLMTELAALNADSHRAQLTGRGAEAKIATITARLRSLQAESDAVQRRENELDAADPDARVSFADEDIALLPALVALHTTSTSVGLPAADATLLELWGTEFPQLTLRAGTVKTAGLTDQEKQLAEAAAGDGRQLAGELGGSLRMFLSDGGIMAVLPRVVTGRADLLRQLEWSAPSKRADMDGRFPFNLAFHAVARRDLFRVAGLTEAAARWDEIYRRVDHVLRDRRKLVALMLWHL